MNPLDEAAEDLVGFETELDNLAVGPFQAEGITANFVVTLLQRLRSTYSAMSQLLRAGHHDEMVLLLRRQLEDSMRLHYLLVHRDRSDALILGHQRMRESQVRKTLDRAVNDPTSASALPDLKKMVALRRDRIKQLDDQASELELEPEQFPKFEEMAVELGRAVDIVPYASASEVAHSAVSAATDGYVTARQDEQKSVRLVGLRSENPSDRLGYARAAINATGMALAHGLLLLDMQLESSTVARNASARVEALKARQREISAE